MPRAWLLGLLLLLAGAPARADQVWTVSIDTSQLAANYTGPFALDFELIGTNGNTVTLSDFAFGGGGAGPGPTFATPGASGDLGSSVTLTDDATNFFIDFNQQFTPGTTLHFTMDSTLIFPPGGTPDLFSMVILEQYDTTNGYNPFDLPPTGGTPIPTTDPSGADTFLNVGINGPGLTTVNAYNTPNGDITIAVTPAGAVPEPSGGLLLLLGALGVSGAIYRGRNVSAREEAYQS
jgi:hypothetical protein